MCICFIGWRIYTAILRSTSLTPLLLAIHSRDRCSEILVHWVLLGRYGTLCLLLGYHYVGWIFDRLSLALWWNKLANFQLRCALIWHLGAWGVLRTDWLFFLQRIYCLHLHALLSLFYLLVTKPVMMAWVFLLRFEVDAGQARHDLISRCAAFHTSRTIAFVIHWGLPFTKEVTLFAHAHVGVHLDCLEVFPKLWVYLLVHGHLWSLEDVL